MLIALKLQKRQKVNFWNKTTHIYISNLFKITISESRFYPAKKININI